MNAIAEMVSILLTMPPYRRTANSSESLTCSVCGRDELGPDDFYQRQTPTVRKDRNNAPGQKVGAIIQPCKQCRKLYQSKRRRIKREHSRKSECNDTPKITR